MGRELNIYLDVMTGHLFLITLGVDLAHSGGGHGGAGCIPCSQLGVSRWHLIRKCERSLKWLGTDHIDIYHIHEWDGQTPVEETLETLHTLQ